MRKVTVAPGTAVHVRYQTPGMDAVVVRAQATDRVNLLVLDQKNYDKYDAGEPYQATAASKQRLTHEMAVRLPAIWPWYLTIENPTDSIADVNFEVVERFEGTPSGVGILSGNIFRR